MTESYIGPNSRTFVETFNGQKADVSIIRTFLTRFEIVLKRNELQRRKMSRNNFSLRGNSERFVNGFIKKAISAIFRGS